MSTRQDILSQIDWLSISLYAILVILGWFNIHAAVYSPDIDKSIFDLSMNSGKQMLWIFTSIAIITAIFIIDFKFYDNVALLIYATIMALLILVLLFGEDVNGARSWFKLGPLRFQPSELAKFSTALALAKIFSEKKIKFYKIKDLLLIGSVMAFPAILIILQKDTGSALVFSSFILVFYREGLTPLILILGVIMVTLFVLTLIFAKINIIIGIGIIVLIAAYLFRKKIKNVLIAFLFGIIASGVVFGVDFFVNEVLQPHQQNRIKVLVNPDADPLGAGWNVTQSKIAIGSGGLYGKGFLKGTQTKFDFVPEQSTDFIFCTIGEEHGFIGSSIVIILFVVFLSRIVIIAERQTTTFSRVYAYSVASILFFHFAINIGMTIGLAPVVGIPLPFFSYGGSSLWSFTILLFILLKLDAHRMQHLGRN